MRLVAAAAADDVVTGPRTVVGLSVFRRGAVVELLPLLNGRTSDLSRWSLMLWLRGLVSDAPTVAETIDEEERLLVSQLVLSVTVARG